MNTSTLAALFNTIVTTGDRGHAGLSNLPIAARGIIGLSDTVRLMTDTSGNLIVPDNAGSAFYHLLSFTTPSAVRTITLPNASGTLLLTGNSQAITSPVITTGLTASGSASNDFSGSTGTFKTSTGAVTVGPGAVTISGPPSLAYSAFTASGAGTVALSAAQSGQTFKLDAATGVVYTLPAPVVGLTYNFQVTVSVTSNSHEVRTNTGTVFIGGVLAQIGSATTFGFLADLAATQAYKANGSTTGGLIGTQFTLTCVSATVWMISGINVGSGTAATPFTATP